MLDISKPVHLRCSSQWDFSFFVALFGGKCISSAFCDFRRPISLVPQKNFLWWKCLQSPRQSKSGLPEVLKDMITWTVPNIMQLDVKDKGAHEASVFLKN